MATIEEVKAVVEATAARLKEKFSWQSLKKPLAAAG